VVWAAACAPAGPSSDFSPITPEWCQSLPRAGYAALERIPVADDWFEVYRVGDGVLAIYEPKQWQEVISYLILGQERALLFDTGMGISAIGRVVKALTDKPVAVLNSHTHPDHVGGNAEFDVIYAMDTDFTRERARGLDNAAVKEEVASEALCAPLPAGVTPDTYMTRPFTISETIGDGRSIDLGNRTLEVLHIPGHTPDAIALLDRAAGYVWTGDSFYEGPIWLFWAGTDLEAYGRSVERLAGLVPALTRVFPAHNTPVAEPARLTELRDAFRGALDGSLAGRAREDGLVEYDAGSFSLLMQPLGRR
jgi:glyoxylase-like metal-dependent hydrolase (beta-lactamase superfamily II)